MLSCFLAFWLFCSCFCLACFPLSTAFLPPYIPYSVSRARIPAQTASWRSLLSRVNPPAAVAFPHKTGCVRLFEAFRALGRAEFSVQAPMKSVCLCCGAQSCRCAIGHPCRVLAITSCPTPQLPNTVLLAHYLLRSTPYALRSRMESIGATIQ